jgi:hypothetical protein
MNNKTIKKKRERMALSKGCRYKIEAGIPDFSPSFS